MHPTVFYNVYTSPDAIQYDPGVALKEGLGMVSAIAGHIQKLEIASQLRKDVWRREIQSLQNQEGPTTMIAVCGATGAGKSSSLNALLNDNIVPTNGMRACTSVVTEISYHAKHTIDADVSFLSETEWREELIVLQHDMVDEYGKLKRSTDLCTEAQSVAWSKVHAVYPSIIPEQFVNVAIDEIISFDPIIKKIMGSSKHITAKDSETFGKKIAKYIDSKRGDVEKKSNNNTDKDKGKERSLAHKDLTATSLASNIALWPLIRSVKIRCRSPALSTGAIFVDLPGVADSNAARNNIAKDYMKKCNCVWILAPITRAVDDKTARDLMGNAFKAQLMSSYDASAISFIATKCDDISCSEIISSLNLDDDAELLEIERQISQCKEDAAEWTDKKADAETTTKGINTHQNQACACLAELHEHLRALKEGRIFVPVLTSTTMVKTSSETLMKRKNTRGEKKDTRKKRRTDRDEPREDDPLVIDENEDVLTSSDADSDEQSNDDNDSSHTSGYELGSHSRIQKDENEKLDEVTVEMLQAKIQDMEDAIQQEQRRLLESYKQEKEIGEELANIKEKQLKAQRQKNAFCSLKRSKFSRNVLKEDFRTGLKDLDDAAAEERDSDSFGPSVNLRNYDEIDLPVFMCSARDYVRLKSQVRGDGEPTCFSKLDDTGIPELQEWCHQLTVSSRERAARNFLAHLRTFVDSVRTYVQDSGDVTASDREAMRAKWESTPALRYGWSDDSYHELSTDDEHTEAIKQEAGNAVGVTPRLVKDFEVVVDSCVEELKARFRESLERKCTAGAAKAAQAAITTSDAFAASMHWRTYRAVLCRNGSWRQDLNIELSNPLTRRIASSWCKVFEADLFEQFEKTTMDAINKVLGEIEDCTAGGLKEHARKQAELSLKDARFALRRTLDVVRSRMKKQQKEASRSFAPEVKTKLYDGYRAAMEESGEGSVTRQKTVFRNFLASVKNQIFEDAATVLLDSLDAAAYAVGSALSKSLVLLAQKIEVSVAVLWEHPLEDPPQVRARTEVVAAITEIIEQVQMWMEAEQNK
ncbi:hypothetical protein BKA93DRAFT_737025 [Sparassis latifolia]